MRIRPPFVVVLLSLSFIMALAFLPLSLFAQKARRVKANKSLAICTLDRSASPKVHGLYVGMPAEEFLKMYPSSKPNTLGNPELGEISYDVVEKEQPSANVRIVVIKFLDGRLSFVSFSYWNFDPVSDEDFVRQVAKQFNLPSKGWKVDAGFRAMECRGFRVQVCKCEGPREPGPSLILDDPETEQIVQERLNAKKKEEQERRRREEQERRIFKP